MAVPKADGNRIFYDLLTGTLFYDMLSMVVAAIFAAHPFSLLPKEELSVKGTYEKPVLVKHEPLRDVTAIDTSEIWD